MKHQILCLHLSVNCHLQKHCLESKPAILFRQYSQNNSKGIVLTKKMVEDLVLGLLSSFSIVLLPWHQHSSYHYLWSTLFGWKQVIFTIQQHQILCSAVLFLTIKIITKDWLKHYFHFGISGLFSSFFEVFKLCFSSSLIIIKKKKSLICCRQTELYETVITWPKIESLIRLLLIRVTYVSRMWM